ncbi:MAG TPA: hypothetical protein VML55_21820 [Planctomycetaceae bacterium]|nr:hypothetical protein [Planctomycetaceae bacterium]
MRNPRALLVAATFCLTASLAQAFEPQTPAFPGAEGFGAQARGGRGGRVIEVTNLNDRGPGSLRAAIEARGPRIVVFRTGGTIELQSELVLTEPYITIAGQTAPGDGITLKTHPSIPQSALTIKGGAHDVVIRYIRSRPGPSTVQAVRGDDSQIKDALQILDAHDVIIDHCSFSWASDEVVSTFSTAHDVTIQWCVIAEALRSPDGRGPDGKGLLIGNREARNVSVHHNLLAHNAGRNPLIKCRGPVDLVNNVVLAPAAVAIAVDGEFGRTPVNIVGNHVAAPNSDGLVYGAWALGNRPVSLFVRDNLGPYRTRDEQPQEFFVRPMGGGRKFLVETPHDAPPVTTTSVREAFDRVLAEAGCTRPVRDAVDQRIVQDVRQQRTRLIRDPSEVGGWPELATGTPPADSDHDGMPDDWEREHGFDPRNPADGAGDADGDGYTNVEEFLNGTSLRVCERKGTGSRRVRSIPAKTGSASVPVPFLSQTLRANGANQP